MSNNLFGTDGIRSAVGTAPLTLEAITRLGQAIALWAQATYGNRPRALLGHDTRESCAFIKSALKGGLLLHPIDLCDAQVIPTPAVCNVIHRAKNFDFGIIISASHNPYHDNGIKIVDARRGKLGLDDEQAISQLFHELQKHGQAISYKTFGQDTYWPEAQQHYIDDVIKYFEPGLLRKLTVVLDCANGATAHVAPIIFERLGARVLAIHNSPNGTNINNKCGSLFPQDLQQQVLVHKADIGFAFDGDGDRLTTINRRGQLKDGDAILGLLCEHPRYRNERAFVGTIMSNQGLEAFVQAQGKRFIRTAVGDKFVAQALEQEKALLGGEPSGHTIMADYLTTGDGIFAALRLIETVRASDNWDLQTFKRFPQVLVNLPVSKKKDLHSPVLAAIIEENRKRLGSGRLIVRYSGTENILRVMVEEENHDNAQHICANLSEALRKKLL